MSDSDVGKVAEAVKEVAKFGQEGIKASDKACSFLAAIFKDAIEQVGHIVGDKLRYARWKNINNIAEKVEEDLKRRGVTDTRVIPLKLSLPILEDSSLEDDDEMQNIWAKLISNALDPNFTGKITYGFTEIIKNLNPKEAYMLQKMYYAVMSHESNYKYNITFAKKQFIELFKISDEEYQLMANNLIRVQCISPGIVTIPGIVQNGYPTTIYRGTDDISITELGIKFVESCIKGVELVGSA